MASRGDPLTTTHGIEKVCNPEPDELSGHFSTENGITRPDVPADGFFQREEANR
jgi:hypothetical protein